MGLEQKIDGVFGMNGDVFGNAPASVVRESRNRVVVSQNLFERKTVIAYENEFLSYMSKPETIKAIIRGFDERNNRSSSDPVTSYIEAIESLVFSYFSTNEGAKKAFYDGVGTVADALFEIFKPFYHPLYEKHGKYSTQKFRDSEQSMKSFSENPHQFTFKYEPLTTSDGAKKDVIQVCAAPRLAKFLVGLGYELIMQHYNKLAAANDQEGLPNFFRPLNLQAMLGK